MYLLRPIAILILAGSQISTPPAPGPASATQAPAAQSPSAAAPSVPSPQSSVLHANANLVQVDVVVTERDKAVHGLDRQRFHIFEDGHEQAIAAFDEHQPSDTAALPVKPAPLPPHVFTNRPVYPEASAVNVLLLDGLNTPTADQLEVRQQMIEYLGKVSPGTSLAIFTLSSRLRLAEGFTTDVARLVKALKSTKNGAQQSVILGSDTPTTLSAAPDEMATLGANAGAMDSSQMQSFIASMQQFAADTDAFQTDIRVRMTLDAMEDLARYLNAIPGRKNLIWFSGSFPIALDPDDTMTSPFQAMRTYSDDISEASQLLSAARVAVYPVDARGLMSPPTSSASYTPSSAPTSRNPIKGANFGGDVIKFLQQTASEHASMEQIAEQTGGKAYYDTNGLKEAVDKAIDNGTSFYTIAYIPAANQPDGKFHAIKLRIDNADYKLAYRHGYYADSSTLPSNNNPGRPSVIAAAAVLGAPPTTQILLQARALPASDPLLQSAKLPEGPAGALTATLKGPVSRYIVDVKVDPHGLTFTATPQGAHGVAIEFLLVAYDADAKRVNYYDRSVQLVLKDDAYARIMAASIPVRLAIDLPSGPLTLRVAVHDLAANRAGSLEIPVTVASK